MFKSKSPQNRLLKNTMTEAFHGDEILGATHNIDRMSLETTGKLLNLKCKKKKKSKSKDKK